MTDLEQEILLVAKEGAKTDDDYHHNLFFQIDEYFTLGCISFDLRNKMYEEVENHCL